MDQKHINETIKKIIILLFRPFAKINDKRVLLSGFPGSYSDNTKYICEKLHEINPDIDIYWALGSNKSSNNKGIPSYVHILYTNTINYFWTVNTAKVLVDNYYGFFISDTPSVFDRMLRNKKQYNISTWHGTPLKRIGADAEKTSELFECSSSVNMFVSGCKYTQDRLYSAYLKNIKQDVEFKLLGTPRNDILFDKSKITKNRLKNKFNIDANIQVVLYAPTFRNKIDDSGLIQLRMMNIDVLLDCLHNRFGGEWVFVFRVHHEVENAIKNCINLNDKRIINGNEYPDMAEYLAITDCLITDYSGSLFDFCLTGKPCFLFAHDLYNYSNSERGLYLPIEKLPYDFSETFEELLLCIRTFDKNKCDRRVDDFNRFIGNVEKGDAALQISLIIQRILKHWNWV